MDNTFCWRCGSREDLDHVIKPPGSTTSKALCSPCEKSFWKWRKDLDMKKPASKPKKPLKAKETIAEKCERLKKKWETK